jgi:hypothetical protein
MYAFLEVCNSHFAFSLIWPIIPDYQAYTILQFFFPCGSFSNKAKAEIKLLKDDLKHGIFKLGIVNGNKNKI